MPEVAKAVGAAEQGGEVGGVDEHDVARTLGGRWHPDQRVELGVALGRERMRSVRIDALFPEDASVLTVEFKLNLLAPAKGERIVAEGFVVKPGRTLAITRGEVHAEDGGKRTLVAIMQQTLMVMRGRADG